MQNQFWNGRNDCWPMEELELHLLGLVEHEHLSCWWLFVQACILLSQPIISHADILKGDHYLLEFCSSLSPSMAKDIAHTICISIAALLNVYLTMDQHTLHGVSVLSDAMGSLVVCPIIINQWTLRKLWLSVLSSKWSTPTAKQMNLAAIFCRSSLKNLVGP